MNQLRHAHFRNALLVCLFFTGSSLLFAETIAAKADKEEELEGDVYPLDKCIVSGMKLGSMGDPYIYDLDGREIRFCCKGCVSSFEKDRANLLGKIDTEIIKQQLDHYPLDTCVVSGENLGGEMGEPVNYVHKNRLVRFCCRGCINQFNKDPQTFWKKIDQAVIDKQKPTYPLTSCVVSGQRLGSMGEPVDYVHANRLLRFCCKGCINAFRKEPLKYTAMIDKALEAQQPPPEGSKIKKEVGTKADETSHGSGEKTRHESHGEGSMHKY